LRANGVKVADSWDTAYYNDFTAGGGDGKYPIVVSYASSPPATVIYANDPKPTEPTTASVDSSCFRQVEFAGILRGTTHEHEARQLIDFMVGQQFQSQLPLTNFVYPVRLGTPLPELFQKYAPLATNPLSLTPDEISTNRDKWVEQWTETVVR
jgi:thiamine transport system substrate-binding protein